MPERLCRCFWWAEAFGCICSSSRRGNHLIIPSHGKINFWHLTAIIPSPKLNIRMHNGCFQLLWKRQDCWCQMGCCESFRNGKIFGDFPAQPCLCLRANEKTDKEEEKKASEREISGPTGLVMADVRGKLTRTVVLSHSWTNSRLLQPRWPENRHSKLWKGSGRRPHRVLASAVYMNSPKPHNRTQNYRQRQISIFLMHSFYYVKSF